MFNPYAKNEVYITSFDKNNKAETFDISSLVDGIQTSTTFKGQAGKMTFTIQKDLNDILNIYNGSIVQFIRDGKGIFYGYVFSMGTDASETYKITAYDQMRYLKNQETIYLENKSVSDVFVMLCKKHQIPKFKVITPTKYIAPKKVYNHQTLFSILDDQMMRADIAEKKQYFLRDNFGVLEFNELANCKTDIILGEKSLLSSYQFEISIDKDTYNQVKVMKPNKKTKKWETYIEKDSTTIKRWGFLQKVEMADEHQNEAQLKKLAQDLIKLHNRETRTLRLSALGVDEIVAGSGISVNIPKLRTTTTSKDNKVEYLDMWVVGATHSYNKGMHTMDLEVAIP